MFYLSIIIPAFNESERIIPTLRSYYKHLKDRAYSHEIIVVDDGSTDTTVQKLVALQGEIPTLRFLRLRKNRGKGAAVKVGMLNASGQYRLFADADGSTPISELEKILEPLVSEESEVSIGSRYAAESQVNQSQPWLRRKWSRVANVFVQGVFLPGIVDPQCGFKAFTADASDQIFSNLRTEGWSFDIEVLHFAKRYGLRIKEVPVQWSNDDRTKGKLSDLPREFLAVYKLALRLD